jgi:hypothetical protein
MKLYMFRAVPLPTNRSLFIVYSALVYVIQIWRQLLSCVPSLSYSKAVFKPVWHITVPSVQWISSRWRAEELPETCRVSCRSKFVKLVHLVGFIIKGSSQVTIDTTVTTCLSIKISAFLTACICFLWFTKYTACILHNILFSKCKSNVFCKTGTEFHIHRWDACLSAQVKMT